MKHLAIDIFITFFKNPPKQDLLNKIQEEQLWQRWFLKNENPLQKQALKLLSYSKEDEKMIGYDFTCLFLSDIDFVKAPPYASFYLDKDKEIYSNNSKKVKNIFLKYNFLTFLENEPQGSLINELLFIEELLKNNNEEILKEFLEEEFFTWFNAWNEDLEKEAKSDFYKGLAMHMRDFFNNLT